MKEVLSAIKVLNDIRRQPNPRRLALMEGHVNCNRRCDYCEVPKRWDKEEASTLEQTFRQIDWLYKEGFRVLNYVGGEPLAESLPLGAVIPQPTRMCPRFYGRIAAEQPEEKFEEVAPFRTKEEITFFEHTLKVIEYASKKGIVTNLTTNGDFIDYYKVRDLKRAGLDVLAFSLHNLNEASTNKIIGAARMTAREGIVPIISVVFTKEMAAEINKTAEICAANGILFTTAVVQERGGGFSAVPEESKIPSSEEQRAVFDKLLELKKKGFIRTGTNYLQNAPKYSNNSWKCDPQTDFFIHVRALGKGKVGVCSESPKRFQLNKTELKDEEWRNAKKETVEKCGGCLYACHYESENQDLKGDFRTFLNMLLIKSGQAGLVSYLGRKALGNRFGEVKPISITKEEDFGLRTKMLNSFPSRLKNGASQLLGTAVELGVVLPIVMGYGLIKGKSPNQMLRKYITVKGALGS